MQSISFVKMQATGNDFVLIHTHDMDQDWSELARAMCQRHFGIGSDGLLLVSSSHVADCSLHMFNPDGSEAEACGNGIRCVAKYVIDEGQVNLQHKQLAIETIAGIRRVDPLTVDGKVDQVQVRMGKPHFNPEEIPLSISHKNRGNGPITDYPISISDGELALTFISMGNPHAVCFSETSVSEFPLKKVGPSVEHHHLFPQRTNFELANVLNRREIEARVWERGVGETLSCGTGACAIAVAAQLHNYVDREVDILLPGGTLTIDWDGDGTGEVMLSGPVRTVYAGEWVICP